MNDDIIWGIPTPPPRYWYARHKAGEALGDSEAAKESAADDINADDVLKDMLRHYLQGVAAARNIGTNPPNAHGLFSQLNDLQKDYTGNPLVDISVIPDYSAAYGHT